MQSVMKSLRRMEVAEATREALVQIEKCRKQTSAGIPGLGDVDVTAVDIAQEFVFHQTGSKSGHSKKLNAIHELQVLEAIANYFEQGEKSYEVKQFVFSSLFGNHLDDRKLDLLSKLVSMAVAVRSRPLLDCVAVLMQEHGCSSKCAVGLARTVVQDYCMLVPGATSLLQQLPELSPHFTCTFITATTALYGFHFSGKGCVPDPSSIPPPALLQMITDWVKNDSRLCLVSIISQSAELKQKGIFSAGTPTPIPGLVNWCIKAPLLTDLKTDTSEPGGEICKIQTLYSRLHLGLLQTLLLYPSQGLQGALFCVGDVEEVVRDLQVWVKSIPSPHDAETVQMATDRLGQALQVAMATGALQCSRVDLAPILQTLPQHKLLLMVSGQTAGGAAEPMQQ